LSQDALYDRPAGWALGPRQYEGTVRSELPEVEQPGWRPVTLDTVCVDPTRRAIGQRHLGPASNGRPSVDHLPGLQHSDDHRGRVGRGTHIAV